MDIPCTLHWLPPQSVIAKLSDTTSGLLLLLVIWAANGPPMLRAVFEPAVTVNDVIGRTLIQRLGLLESRAKYFRNT